MGKTFYYARVSTKDQNIDRQVEAFKEYGATDERDIIIDKASGKDFNRSGYQLLTTQLLREGDTLVIKELDRLGRNMEQIKKEWNDLTKREINIVVLDTPILNTTGKTDLEKTLISNIVFELLSYMAEKEREKIRQRQAEGIKALKERNGGKGIGRPKIAIPEGFEEVYNNWKAGSITAKAAMEQLGLKRTTFYSLVKEYEGGNLGGK